jgi:hypothetical protein
MLFKIALSILLIWFIAGVIPLVFRSAKFRLPAFVGLSVFGVALLTHWLA